VAYRKSTPAQHQLTIEDERKRIAGDLHDGLGQTLSLIKMRVENARVALNGQEIETTKEILADVSLQLRSAIGEVRRLATELRPAMLDDLGLIPTLEWLARQFQAAHTRIGFHMELDISENAIPPDIKTVVFRLIQEALSNVAKHANASSVYFYVRSEDHVMKVGVVDNGAGFEPAQLLAGKFCLLGTGVNSMRERVEVSGGKFKIRSRIGAGTAVTATWGLSEESGFLDSGRLDSFSSHNTMMSPLDIDLSL
jgi:signal transduction histidine kinase